MCFWGKRTGKRFAAVSPQKKRFVRIKELVGCELSNVAPVPLQESRGSEKREAFGLFGSGDSVKCTGFKQLVDGFKQLVETPVAS